MDSKNKTQISQSTIQAFKDGDEKAFGAIFHQFTDRIYHFAQNYLHNPSQAEEVTQEVFVKLWEARKSINPDANFSAYLFTITRNIIFNQHKKKVHEWDYAAHLKNHLLKIHNETEEAVFLHELSEILDNHIQAMPEKRQQVFVLSRIKGLSHKEISKQLNISVKTIEVHIGLALKTLRHALADYYIFVLLMADFYAMSTLNCI